MKLYVFNLWIVVCLSLSACASFGQLTGRVISVQDGDTFTMLTKKDSKVKIRLYGIDAPEKGQDFNRKSKEYLAGLVADKKVEVEYKDTDQYKRILGVVYVNKLNINEEMLREGLAWRYKYNDDSHYLKLQEKAKKKRLNIWSLKKPIDPWQWRKERSRNGKNQ